MKNYGDMPYFEIIVPKRGFPWWDVPLRPSSAAAQAREKFEAPKTKKRKERK